MGHADRRWYTRVSRGSANIHTRGDGRRAAGALEPLLVPPRLRGRRSPVDPALDHVVAWIVLDRDPPRSGLLHCPGCRMVALLRAVPPAPVLRSTPPVRGSLARGGSGPRGADGPR